MMNNNSIDSIQSKYTFAVPPVQFFEPKNSQSAQKSSFDFINQMNSNGFNPFHPNVQSQTLAKKLDILS